MLNNFSDKLFYALSAKNRVTWQSYCVLYESLVRADLPEDDESMGTNLLRFFFARGLSSLGHLDFHYSNKIYLQIAPPTLVRLPIWGTPQFLLVGGRSIKLIDDLFAVTSLTKNLSVHLKTHKADPVNLPTSLFIHAEEVESVEIMAKKLNIHMDSTPSAWKIVSLAGSLPDYMAALRFSDIVPTGTKENFQIKIGRFRPDVAAAEKNRLLRIRTPYKESLYYYTDGNLSAPIDPDWGRFALAHLENVQCISYSLSKQIMCSSIPLPKILDRAAALASGEPPSRLKQKINKLSIYKNAYKKIPQTMAHQIADKLGQVLKLEK